MFVELYVRSAGDGDHAASGSGGLSDGHAGGHTDGDHHSHAHPGTVLFLFVAIAVGGNVNITKSCNKFCYSHFFLLFCGLLFSVNNA